MSDTKIDLSGFSAAHDAALSDVDTADAPDPKPAAAPKIDLSGFSAAHDAVAKPSTDTSHDVKPFLGKVWEGAKKSADDFSSKPLPTLAYDGLVKPAVDAYNDARANDSNVLDAGAAAANKTMETVADAGKSLVAPATMPLKAYLQSRNAGNSVENALKDARNVGMLAAAPAVAGGALKAVAPAVGAAAENRAASAMGWSKAMRNKFGPEAASAAGRVGLDEGVVTPLASTADKIERMQGVRDTAGQKIGDTMSRLDEAGVQEFNPLSTASKVHSEMGDRYKNEPLFSSQSDQYDNLMKTILKRGTQDTSYADAQALKQLVGQYGYKEGMAVPGREQAQQAYGIINKDLDSAVDRGAQQLGDSELLQNLQGARTNYGAAQNTLTALGSKQAGELGNQQFGLSDAVLAAPQLAHPAGALTAAATVGLKHAVAAYGNNVAAWTGNVLAKLLASSPEIFGAYAPVLQSAAARGQDSLSATHKVLLKTQPGYGKQLGEP